MMRFRQWGNPYRLVSSIDGLQQAIKEVAEKDGKVLALKMANEFQRDLVRHIQHQLFNHAVTAPLRPRYKEYKRKKGLDPRILIATGRYLQKIVVIPTKHGAGVGMARGTHPRLPGSKRGRGISYDKLADYLEWGTSKMKPRPHWRPIIAQWEQKSEDVANTFMQAIMAKQQRYEKTKKHPKSKGS